MAKATLISINVLFNAYTPIYDLVLLAAGALLTVVHLVGRYGGRVERHLAVVQLVLAALYFGPHLSQATAIATGWQPLALVLLAIVAGQAWMVVKACEPAGSSDRAAACAGRQSTSR